MELNNREIARVNAIHREVLKIGSDGSNFMLMATTGDVNYHFSESGRMLSSGCKIQKPILYEYQLDEETGLLTLPVASYLDKKFTGSNIDQL